MSYQQVNAIQKHYLDSILPYQIKAYQTKIIPKTRQFYKPEQFIWNNPHRTSNSIYKFYHKYNQHYENEKQPIIKKIQQQDKKNRQMGRIRKLSEVKLQTRKRFFNRKYQRQNLQYLSGTRLPQSSQSQYLPTATKRFSTISHYQAKPTKYQPMIQSNMSKFPMKKKSTITKFQQSYLSVVQKSLLKKKLLQKLIVNQTHRKQQQFKQEFQKQKQFNQKKLSRISKFAFSKAQKSYSCKQN